MVSNQIFNTEPFWIRHLVWKFCKGSVQPTNFSNQIAKAAQIQNKLFGFGLVGWFCYLHGFQPIMKSSKFFNRFSGIAKERNFAEASIWLETTINILFLIVPPYKQAQPTNHHTYYGQPNKAAYLDIVIVFHKKIVFFVKKVVPQSDIGRNVPRSSIWFKQSPIPKAGPKATPQPRNQYKTNKNSWRTGSIRKQLRRHTSKGSTIATNGVAGRCSLQVGRWELCRRFPKETCEEPSHQVRN